MKKVRAFTSLQLSKTLIVLFTVACACCFLAYRLGTLIPELFPLEKSVMSSVSGRHAVFSVLNIFYTALQYGAIHIPFGSETLRLRLPSIMCALLSCVLFMYICRRWYGRRTMLTGNLLFATAAWLLHAGRLDGLGIEYILAMLLLLAAHIGLNDHYRRFSMVLAWLEVNIIVTTIPGMVWFVILSLAWQWRTIMLAWKNMLNLKYRISWVIVGLLSLGSILFEIDRSYAWLPWLGIPRKLPEWHLLGKNFISVFTNYAYHGPSNPQLWLAHLPIIDIFILSSFVMGAIFYVLHWKALRARLLLSYIILGAVLISLNYRVLIDVLFPLVYLVAAGGISYAMYCWTRRFPRNQFARNVGIIAIITLVGFSVLYNLRQYFIAWPKNSATLEALHRSSSAENM